MWLVKLMGLRIPNSWNDGGCGGVVVVVIRIPSVASSGIG